MILLAKNGTGESDAGPQNYPGDWDIHVERATKGVAVFGECTACVAHCDENAHVRAAKEDRRGG